MCIRDSIYSVGHVQGIQVTTFRSHFQVAFATVAGFLTTTYAVYAKQSGIPEIKTVLGGFVIRRFMGAWTLVIKSVGLVRSLPLQGSKRLLICRLSACRWRLVYGWVKKVRWFTLPVAARICL